LKVVLNGAERELPDAASVADAVALAGAEADRGVAVAVAGEVIPRAEWPDRRLSDGEAVEVVHAVQGG
jgi:sulfur carrier protein